MNVALQVNGAYKQVTDFISKLMGISSLVDVGSVNLTGVGGVGKTTASITTQIFFVPPPAGVGSGGDDDDRYSLIQPPPRGGSTAAAGP